MPRAVGAPPASSSPALWQAVLALSAATVLAACVTEVPIGIELRPPRLPDGGPDVPSEVVSHEVRLYRLGDDDECPPLGVVASAAPFAQLGHAQSFAAAEGMGEAIGELPPGRWALAALSRDATCAPRLFGCAELTIALTSPANVVIPLEPVNDDTGCGACRACDGGACDPVGAICR